MITIKIPPETGIVKIAAAFEIIGLKLQFVPLEDHWTTVPLAEEILIEAPKDYIDVNECQCMDGEGNKLNECSECPR